MSKKQDAPLLKDEAQAAVKAVMVAAQRVDLYSSLYKKDSSDLSAMCCLEAWADMRKTIDKAVEVNERVQKAMTNWSLAK